MLPQYEFFYKKTNWGDLMLLKNTLETVRNYILNQENINNFQAKLKEVYNIIPNSDLVQSDYTLYAYNSSASIYYLANAVVSGKNENLFYIPQLSMESAFLFTQDLMFNSIYDNRELNDFRSARIKISDNNLANKEIECFQFNELIDLSLV